LERGYEQLVFCSADEPTLKRLEKMIEGVFGEWALEGPKVAFMRLGRFLS